MKTFRRSLLLTLGLFLGLASLAYSSLPSLQVTVSNSAGKLVYKGATNAQGLFSTANLPPGDYIVQFNSTNLKGRDFALVVAAGKKKVVANSVAGAKFAAGGVAMKVEVEKPINLTGQVTDVAATQTASNAKVKYINGKKYVWVANEAGSNLGGRWVDASSPEARGSSNLTVLNQDQVRTLQGAGGPTALTGSHIPPGPHNP